MRLIVEGWRFHPHSYGVVAQFLALELARRDGVEVYFRDLPFVYPSVKPGLGDPEMERRLREIPTAAPDQTADATIRVLAPAPLRPAQAGRTLVFCTAEFGIVHAEMLNGSLATFNATENLAMMTPSEWSRSGMIRGGADPDKVVVVPHGFDPAIFHPVAADARARLRAELGWADDEFVFLNAGALTANKGVFDLLRAFAKVVVEFPRARLVLKGLDRIYPSSKSLDEYKRALADDERARIENRVTYIGRTLTYAETAALYQAADAYASPYRGEGFNLPVLEAAACGLPVVCTAGGPTDEFTDPSFCLRVRSQLVPARVQEIPAAQELAPDADDLERQLRALLNDVPLVAAMRSAAPQNVSARFTWAHVADRLMQVIGDPQSRCWGPRPGMSPPAAALPGAARAAEVHARASRAYQSGDRSASTKLCEEALSLDPLHAESIYLLGVIALEANRNAEALRHFHHASALRPRDASYASAVGEAYRSLGRAAEAAECFRVATRIDAGFAAGHNALGEVLLDGGDAAAAEACFRAAIAVRPNYERAHMNLGRALHVKGDLDGAAAALGEAVRINPKYATAHNNFGAVLQAQGNGKEAASHFRDAIAIKPDYPEAHFNLGGALLSAGDPAAAVAEFQEAIRLRPRYARAHAQMAQALFEYGQVATSVQVFQAALSLNPNDQPTRLRLGEALRLLGRLDEARAAFDVALQAQPDSAEAFAHRFRVRQELCAWDGRDAEIDRLWADAAREMAAGKAASLHPLHVMSLPWDGARQLAFAKGYAREFERAAARVGARPAEPAPGSGRIKVGYLSRDFYDHPVGHLILNLFGLHDRNQFEVHAYSFGPNDQSAYRRTIESGCECFHEVSGVPLTELDRRIRADGIHILVDLMGFTGLARTACLALRPAPVQVNWLGYAGTMGAGFIDYIIGDAVVTPPRNAAEFSEQIVRMPHSFMVTDYKQPIAAAAPSRREQGLPETGVVFCCFNNAPKIEPTIFGVWMKILSQVPGSVAWLSVREPAAQANLRRQAEARGVKGNRLVFSTHVKSKADHLARLGLADLFLDTHYYNAHATTADAMWAGLPLLTCPGDTFASRVAAGVIKAAGIGELVVPDLDAFERTAIELAHDPARLHALGQRLKAGRASAPLFDTPRFTRNLERAYRAMWERYAAGQAPASIDVTE